MLSAVLLAVALAMDAVAVAAARGAITQHAREGVTLAALFGGFQAGMAALGWLAGDAVGEAIARWDHWIAFGLLAGLGIRMIIAGAGGGDGERPVKPPGLGLYLALAIATSIDAAAAGITLPMLAAPPVIALALIGVVTAALSGVGYVLGGKVGARFGGRAEVLGGVVLIAIGTRILVEHLTA